MSLQYNFFKPSGSPLVEYTGRVGCLRNTVLHTGLLQTGGAEGTQRPPLTRLFILETQPLRL
jgi:hypothetical protein